MRSRDATLLLATLAATPVGAQSGATITVDAVVVTVGMTITTLSDLQFGTVVAGVPTAVPFTAAGAGSWRVTGAPNAFASISFTLPATLTNIQAAAGSTMPITFSASDAGWDRAKSDPNGAVVFNPHVGTVGRFGPPPNATLFIWIGGTVSPSAGAKPGIYTGTVILSLVYT